MLTIADIRRRAEERNQRISREVYEHGSGLKAEMGMAHILEAYGDLQTREAVEYLRGAFEAEVDPVEKRRLQYLLADLRQGFLDNHVAALHDKFATQEATKSVELAGESIPFRQAAIRMSNEPDRERRIALQEASCRVIAELSPLHSDALAAVRKIITEDLGYPSYTDFYRIQRGIDFADLATRMQIFLDRTNDLYRRVMDDWTRAGLGRGIDECARHDINFLLRAREFDHAFPESGLIPTLEATVADLDLTLRHIFLDLEKRPTKSPRAFCSPVRVPEEIYLVVSPKGGMDDYSALLHECGHSLHFAHASPDLPYEFRFLGDNSVTETFAFTLEHFHLEPGWLRRHTDLSEDEIARYRFHGLRQLLFMVRRYSAKLEYELELHDNRPLAGKDALYRQHLESVLLYRHFSEYWLFDTDEGYYTAQYLRAWTLAAQLRAYLRRRHGPDYFLQPAAGRDLVDLWSLGQRLSADELATHLGYDGLDVEPLVDEMIGVLGQRPSRNSSEVN
ncbi:MAG: hypothetical protein FJZ01_04045 [Candidatus Sericytochromatia bacterium]|nr:hypothetical protein [Candidatus Tanganyikabacteria bacterium]